MSAAALVILDTNVFVSTALRPHSVPAQVFHAVLERGHFAICEQSVAELERVLSRPKLDRFATRQRRTALLAQVRAVGVPFMIWTEHLEAARGACRDSDDELFLALALAADVATIVTGDDDLLSLTPWRGVAICTPAQYLAQSA